MKTADVEKLLGPPSAVAKMIGVSRAAVAKWGRVVPLESAVALEIASYGRLKVDPKQYERLLAARVYAKTSVPDAKKAAQGATELVERILARGPGSQFSDAAA